MNIDEAIAKFARRTEDTIRQLKARWPQASRQLQRSGWRITPMLRPNRGRRSHRKLAINRLRITK